MSKSVFRLIVPLVLLMLLPLSGFAQKFSVRVTGGQAREPVPGAVVQVVGTKTAGMTDANGNCTISARAGDVLECSCLGYVTATVKVPESGNSCEVFLEEEFEMIDETVVVGYGTLKKSQLVGSVESVSGEVLEDRVNTSITRSLQGAVPGLNIIQSDGKPTHSGDIYIRGNNTSYRAQNEKGGSSTTHSIGQGSSALVLVDGVEASLSTVNPEDVESITVLKDASSSVIYGARAAYGVILVTTKNPSKEKIKVSYNGSLTFNGRTVDWSKHLITNGLEYVERFYEFWTGRTETPTQPGSLPTKMNIYVIPSNYLELYRQHEANGETDTQRLVDGSYIYFGNWNWVDLFYKDYNVSQIHNISVSGSGERVSYSVSGRYYNQDSIYKIGEEDYQHYNMRSKISVKATDWLTLSNNTSFEKRYYKQPAFGRGSVAGNHLWQIAMMGFPVMPPTNEDGTYTIGAAAGGYASFAEGNSGQIDNRQTFVTTFTAKADIVKDVFNVKGDFSYKSIRSERDRYYGPIAYSTAPESTTDYVTREGSTYKRSEYVTDYMSGNVVATFTPKLGKKHDLDVVAGWNIEDYNYSARVITRKGMIYPEKQNFQLMDGDITLADTGSTYGLVGFFGRANYTLLGRYIMEVSARYDGSSKFPVNQQWGFFPSASAGWRVSKEKWMHWSKSWLDNLKLRANAGTLGNGTIAPFKFLNLMEMDKTSSVIDGGFANKVGAPAVVPDNLTWEKVTTYDAGLDADFLRSRLSLSFDWYRRNTTDLYIVGPEIPAIFGSSSPKGNYGALRTDGWELTLSWRDAFKLAGEDFTYSIKGSLWDSRTWVTEYNNDSGDMYDYYVGKELGEIWGFRTGGLFLSNEEAAAYSAAVPDNFHNLYPTSGPYAGDVKFLDVNKDNQISPGSWTVEDHGDLERIGNETPRYQFGLNLDFKWNGFGLGVFFQGVGRRDWYPSQGGDFFWGAYGRPYNGWVLKNQGGDNYAHIDKSTENWTVSNASSNPYWPRRTYLTANNIKGALTFPNDRYLQNAAYVRLKNLTLEYSFSGKWVQRVKMQGLRLYVSAENLLTWSPIFRNTQMFDPETIFGSDTDFYSSTQNGGMDGMNYPMLRSYTIGVNITF